MNRDIQFEQKPEDYDQTRRAVGVEIILGCIAAGPKRPSEVTLLDAGCGTGTYSEALLERVAKVEAIDSNADMLALAAEKLKEPLAQGRARLQKATVQQLPLEDRSVDAIMINRVLHHLEEKAERGFALHRRVFGECARVLRHGGVLVINTSSRAQLDKGFWYHELIPRAATRAKQRFAPLSVLRRLLTEAGFIPKGSIVPLDGVLQGPSYRDPYGPLDPAWRSGDVSWTYVREQELQRVTEHIRELESRDELESFMEGADAMRPAIGQVTFLHATRK